MDAGDINHALNVQFERYDYRLNNSYIFAWESDFLCLSSGGYWVECEVKITRSDFFRDFGKDKHKLFSHLHKGHTLVCEPYPYGMHDKGDFIVGYDQPRIKHQYGDPDRSGEIHWRYQWHNGKWGEWANDYGWATVHVEHIEVYAPVTPIRFRDISRENMPHQFYFTVPRGLVKLEEIPAYAGLIYVDGWDQLEIVRRAPYLHKRKMDLTKILLNKYYNLWRFKAECDKYTACIECKLF